MKGETIIYANNAEIAFEAIRYIVKTKGRKDGHKLIGTAKTPAEVWGLLGKGVIPSVLILDPEFPTLEEGREAITAVWSCSPKTKVITISMREPVPELGQNASMVAPFRAEDLIKTLNNLERW